MSAKKVGEEDWWLVTARLRIQPATIADDDVSLLYQLWTTPDVMRFVGFPEGLRTSRDEIREQVRRYGPDEFNRVLLVRRLDDDRLIGECKLASPDEDDIAHTDIKLLPEFWGHGYGREIKQALVDYLFTHTHCTGVRGTPNQLNAASIRMQEAVGGRRIGEGCHRFPERMRAYTIDVHYFEYVVFRDEWKKRD